jgi:hypothetical protein
MNIEVDTFMSPFLQKSAKLTLSGLPPMSPLCGRREVLQISHIRGTDIFITGVDTAEEIISKPDCNAFDVIICVSRDRYYEPFLHQWEESGREFYHLPVSDEECQEIIDSAAKPVHDIISRSNDQNILVHCRLGVSRSVAVVVYHLMVKFGLDYDTALARVVESRPLANPNSGFAAQLRNEFVKLC